MEKRKCNKCGEELKYDVYIGLQKDIGGKPLYKLYNCSNCNDTYSVKVEGGNSPGQADDE